MTTQLVIFDLDGTIIRDSTAAQAISLAAGTLPEIQLLEAEYRAGHIDSVHFSRRALELWGPDHLTYFSDAWASVAKIDGLNAALSGLRSLGIATCLLTMAPEEFARLVGDFDHIRGSQYGMKILNPEDKPRIAAQIQSAIGADDDDIVALGDSASDVPLFTKYKRTIAVNATEDLLALARHSYSGSNMMDALALEVDLPDDQGGRSA